MPNTSSVNLKDLEIETDIGTYGPDDTVPRAHVLDLSFDIEPELVLIDRDGMDRVFDYDPLVAELRRLARDGHYVTQERLITRMVAACAACPEILTLDICLRKTPVYAGTGSLGVRLTLDAEGLTALRSAAA